MSKHMYLVLKPDRVEYFPSYLMRGMTPASFSLKLVLSVVPDVSVSFFKNFFKRLHWIQDRSFTVNTFALTFFFLRLQRALKLYFDLTL